MPRIAYVNGAYVPHNAATVHIEDRGYQFADGVYEVVGLINGEFADERGHLDRLERSLGELSISMPVSRAALRIIMRELVRRNRIRNASLYIQVTRGVAKRDFKFPAGTSPSLVLTCRPYVFEGNPAVEKGVSAICLPDIRWARRDIKTTALLAQAMAKQKALDEGAGEALMVDSDGFITEASASNFWIIKDGKLKTRAATHDILKGVTRSAIFEVARKHGLEIIEGSITPDEAYGADEAFCSSATSLIVPVTEIDGHTIGSGAPGAVVRDLYRYYRDYAKGGYDEQYIWSA